MPIFSIASLDKLGTCDNALKEICHEAIKIYDFKIICGYRDGEAQNKVFREGKSGLQYPYSKHNKSPSQAVDIAPYPIDWEGLDRFNLLAGIIFGVAHSKGVKLRWGGAWSGLAAMKGKDLGHFELL